MNAPKSSKEKKSLPDKEKKQLVTWFNRIDYWKIVQKTGQFYWDNKKRLLTVSILLLLTGGQAITLKSSFNGNMGGSEPMPGQENSGPADWRTTLSQIEREEDLKIKIRNLFEDRSQLYTDIAIAIALFVVIMLILIALFSLNCYFHLIFINTIKSLDLNIRSSKKMIKRLVAGRWKKLALMRIIFGLVCLASLILFLSPAGFFALERSWPLAIALGGFAFFAILIVFIMISYVFRFSLFYLALSKIGIRQSVDCGYEVFSKFWRESILASLVNFALDIVVMMGVFIILLLSAIALVIIAGVVGLIIYLVMGLAHAEGIAIGVGIVLVLIPLLIIGIVLASIWQGLVLTYWYYIFNELTGCKIPELAEEEVAVKNKKPAVKPVVQKEEGE